MAETNSCKFDVWSGFPELCDEGFELEDPCIGAVRVVHAAGDEDGVDI